MTSIPDALIPTWPAGSHAWAALVLILLMGLFKLDRGTLMYRRANYVDHFGASIITFDLVFGVTFIVASIEGLYPALGANGFVFWATLIPLFVVMAWQWIEVRLSARERIAVAMAGTQRDSTWQPGDPDRRSGIDRRKGTQT